MQERKPLSLHLPGKPRTKKNSGRIVPRGGRHIILPSEAWQEWCDGLAPAIRAALRAKGVTPIDYPVNCAALFYRDALRGDACGFYQGLADLLQHGGAVADDKYIVAWDGSRLLKDSAHSRQIELPYAARAISRRGCRGPAGRSKASNACDLAKAPGFLRIVKLRAGFRPERCLDRDHPVAPGSV